MGTSGFGSASCNRRRSAGLGSVGSLSWFVSTCQVNRACRSASTTAGAHIRRCASGLIAVELETREVIDDDGYARLRLRALKQAARERSEYKRDRLKPHHWPEEPFHTSVHRDR